MSRSRQSRRIWAVGALVLVGLTTGAVIVLVAQEVMRVDPHECLETRSNLAPVLEAESAVVITACQRGGPFLAELKEAFAESGIDRSRLWQTSVLERDGSEAALESWREGRLVSWITGEPWEVPLDPDWSEDPYENVSWQSRYHAVSWLAALARGYRDGDVARGQELRHYLLDWIQDNPTTKPPSVRSWYDHSVAWRTDALASMWDVLPDVLDDAEFATVLEALHLHGTKLHGYLSEERFVGHNHNLFHALSLYNLAVHVPELSGASSWRTDARDRIGTIIPEMLNRDDGVSTEQSAAYHYIALDLFNSADRYLSLFDDGLDGSDGSLLAEATRFAALLPHPMGTLPAIGDTAYGGRADVSMARLAEMVQAGLGTPEAEYVLSRGQSGRRPEDAVFFRGEGYAIFRPSYGEVGPWEDDLHLVVDMGPSRRVHGHDDAMNVLLAAYGEQLLIDSGGPYMYGVPERAQFLGASAHNTVAVDRRTYASGDVAIEHATDEPGYSFIAGSHDNSAGVHHRRTVLLVKPRLLVVVDELRSRDGDDHLFELLYHLPPEADVRARDSTAEVIVGEAAMGLAVTGSGDVALSVREGEGDPLFGWVTRGNSRREPAPVLTFAQRGDAAWYVTVIDPRPATNVAVPEVQVNFESGVYGIAISSGNERWEVRLPSNGGPTVVNSDMGHK